MAWLHNGLETSREQRRNIELMMLVKINNKCICEEVMMLLPSLSRSLLSSCFDANKQFMLERFLTFALSAFVVGEVNCTRLFKEIKILV